MILGERQLKTRLKWLADLQEALGIWHDRQVLHQAVAAALAHAEVLLNEMQAGANTFGGAGKGPQLARLKRWEKIFRLAMEPPGNPHSKVASETDATPKPTACRW